MLENDLGQLLTLEDLVDNPEPIILVIIESGFVTVMANGSAFQSIVHVIDFDRSVEVGNGDVARDTLKYLYNEADYDYLK